MSRPRSAAQRAPRSPARFAAFLRGMNLGKRRITNEELVRCFTELGFADAVAYQASGNVAFDASGASDALARRIEQGLALALGYEVPTFVRTAAEVRELAVATPFADRPAEARGKVQVALLMAPPPAPVMRAVAELETADDWLAVAGSALFWWPRGGMGTTELDLRALYQLLGNMTIRTQGTLARMAARCFPV